MGHAHHIHGHDHAGHAHAHGHGGHGHHHGVGADDDRRWLGLALALIAGFMVVEVVAGLLAGSLALLSDAAHMLTDAGALALALVAASLAARPAKGRYTFGLGRAEVLSAQVNGALLLLLAGVIAVEAIRRLFDPPSPDGATVILVGALGAMVNVGAAVALSKAKRQSLNVAGARAHVLADLYGSLAAIVAGVAVLAGAPVADGLAALVVAGLMVRSGAQLVRDASRVLLERSPLDPEQVGRAMAAVDGVVEVHDLHVWQLTDGFPALSAHVVVRTHDDCHELRGTIERTLHESFGLDHTTLQLDHVREPALLQIDPPPAQAAG